MSRNGKDNGHNNRYVAIDFEVLDSAWRATVISVGVAVIEDNEIKEKKYYTVCPPSKYENPYCVQIHGIHYRDVKDSPSFKEVWDEVDRDYIKGSPIVAHNIGFEKSCINACGEEFGTKTDYQYIDTLALSRKYQPRLRNHKLITVAESFKHKLKYYHKADADAEACAVVFIGLNKRHNLYG